MEVFMGVKENWEKVDEVCVTCGQVTKQQRGITRQNIKRLFSFKPTFTELLITLMLIMVLILAWSYFEETKTSRDWINSMFSGSEDNCKMNCNSKCIAYANQQVSNPDVNVSLIKDG